MCAMLRNTKGISRLSLLILLLASGTVGVVLSYLWTVGYYVETGFKVPEGVTTITITNVTFPIGNSAYFDVTILNPSYSKADANITGIAIVAATNDIELTESIEPSLPYPLRKSEAITFRCKRNWGEFAGQTIRIVVFLQDGSGATSSYETSKVELEIVALDIDTTVTIERFNVTIRNSAESVTSLDVTEILFDSTSIQDIIIQDENATLPLQLQPGELKTFTCNWNLWKKNALGSSHSITAKTLQGYSAAYTTESLPSISLDITDIAFELPDTGVFNLTVTNLSQPPQFVNISRVTITNGTQTFENITIINDAMRELMPGNSTTLRCSWNWEPFIDQEIKMTVHTTQGFYIEKDTFIELIPKAPEAFFTYFPTIPYTGETVTFNASESFDSDGSIVSYSWAFGDGANGTGEVVTHTYSDNGTYAVTLILTDNDGLFDKTSIDITVLNKPPIALFTESATTILIGETIVFNASESYDSDGSIVSYFWDFGDVTNATDFIVSHVYTTNGTFIVTLTVIDDDGAPTLVNATKTVLPNPTLATSTTKTRIFYADEAITFNVSDRYKSKRLHMRKKHKFNSLVTRNLRPAKR